MQIEAVLQVLLEKSDLLSRFPALKWETSHLKPNELPKAAAPTSGPKDTDTKGFYVEHAGIVLLSPFLPAFFDRIGLLKKQHFIDADKQESALLWLHYLCTGKKECPENETLLLKLLCGISPEQPIPKKLNVPAKKLEEAEFLLRTVVEHWPVLKNTSPDGLREGFLQRSGKLINHGGQWQLTVERRPQDILFDQLSWGFSVIKYPWMKEMLVVEW
jgi:hypothetical protein